MHLHQRGLRCRVTLRSWKPHHIILLLVRCPKKKCSGSVHQVAAPDFDKTFCNPHLRSQWALSWTNVKMHLSKTFSFLCRSATAQSSWRGLCLSPKSKLQRKSSLFQKIFNLWENIPSFRKYDAVSDLIYNWVAQRHGLKSALRVVKMVLNTQFYQYLWLSMWFHAKKSKETLKNSKSLILQCKFGSRAQKWPKIAKKTDH